MINNLYYCQFQRSWCNGNCGHGHEGENLYNSFVFNLFIYLFLFFCDPALLLASSSELSVIQVRDFARQQD